MAERPARGSAGYETPLGKWFDQGANLSGGEWQKIALSRAFMRQAPDARPVVVVCNFTPVPRENYRIGVPHGGRWREALNSDAAAYGGGGIGNYGGVEATPMPYEDLSHSLNLTLPPLGALILVPA